MDTIQLGSFRMARWGSENVPFHQRAWEVHSHVAYRKTYDLLPGQSWFDAPVTHGQWEGYVKLAEGTYVPVGAVIAKELIDEGAVFAGFTEMWKGFVVVDHSLTCVSSPVWLIDLLASIKAETGGKLAGFPDTIAMFADGRISFREAKRAKKDTLTKRQHVMADILRALLPGRLDLAVVEWDLPVG